jgi:hypothetical protein
VPKTLPHFLCLQTIKKIRADQSILALEQSKAEQSKFIFGLEQSRPEQTFQNMLLEQSRPERTDTNKSRPRAEQTISKNLPTPASEDIF